jgi:hypothetical protein
VVRSSPRLLSKTGENHGLIKSRLPYPVLLFAGVLSLLLVMVLGLSLGNINVGIHQLLL